MLLTNQKIAILGAGPVGLTMARLLQQRGTDVTVYERDENEQARVWGGTLDLHADTGQAAMRQAGLLESYFALAAPIGRTVVDGQCHVLFTRPPDYASPEINRHSLRQLLLGSLAPGTVVWNRKFTSLDPQAGRWQLHFEHGPSAAADVVIGANGGLTSARQYVTNAKAEYTGTLIVQGEVPHPATACPAFYQLCGGNILMYAGNGRTLVAHPDNNGVLTYNVTFRQSEAWLRENSPDFQQPAQVAEFLAGLFAPEELPCFQPLFRATTTFVGLPARQVSLAEPWHASRPLPITLIGDAAHIMPPFAGQGANMGLQDARLLADNLTSGAFASIGAAIADYEQQMRAYATQAQLETSRNELAMHQPDYSFQARFSS